MDTAFVLAVAVTLAFAFTNGFHDAANAIATLVATRGARPGPAVSLAAVCNLLGPLVLGAAGTLTSLAAGIARRVTHIRSLTVGFGVDAAACRLEAVLLCKQGRDENAAVSTWKVTA